MINNEYSEALTLQATKKNPKSDLKKHLFGKK